MQTLALANLFDATDATDTSTTTPTTTTPTTTTTTPDTSTTTPATVTPPVTVTPVTSAWETYQNSVPKPIRTFWAIARPVSFVACVYHGYKRNESERHPVGWAIGWGILAFFFPLITPTIAVAEGFAKPIGHKRSGFGRRKRRVRRPLAWRSRRARSRK